MKETTVSAAYVPLAKVGRARRAMQVLAVTIAALAGPVSAHADDAAVTFPERDEAWLKEGTFPNVDNLRQMMPGLSKDQVYALLQEPHFSEGFFGVRKWNYIFNFRTGKGNEYVTCQYQIVYDSNGRVKSTHWKEHECDALVAQASAGPAAAVPTVSEHFAVNDDVLFAFDRSSLNDLLPGGRTALDDIAERLNGGYRSLKSVTIIGHADRIGPDAHNQELSLARAQTVRDYLVTKGLPRNPVVVAGAGSTTPVTNGCPAGKTVEAIRCLQPDRRVTIDVAGEKRD